MSEKLSSLQIEGKVLPLVRSQNKQINSTKPQNRTAVRNTGERQGEEVMGKLLGHELMKHDCGVDEA